MADINSLYDHLISSKKITVDDIGTPEQFNEFLKQPDNAKKLYGHLSNVFSPDDIGDEEYFLNTVHSFVHPNGTVSSDLPADAAQQNNVEAPNENEQPEPESTGNYLENVKKSLKEIKQYGRIIVGTGANQFTGSSGDAIMALNLLPELEKSGIDYKNMSANQLLKYQKKKEKDADLAKYNQDVEEWKKRNPDFWNSPFFSKDPYPSQPESLRPHEDDIFSTLEDDLIPDTEKRPYKLLEEALKTDNPQAYLEEKAKQKSWGDEQIADAAKQIATLPESKGIGGFLGSMTPSMGLYALSIASTFSPYTRWLAKPLSMAGTAIIGIDAAGGADMAARQYMEKTGKYIPESDILKTDVVSGASNTFLVGKLGENFLSGAGKLIGKKVSSEIASKIISSPEATNEMGELLERAPKDVSYLKTFTKEGAKKLAKDVGKGFVTGTEIGVTNKIIPMIYENREDHPTLWGIVKSGLESGRDVALMSLFLGGERALVDNYAQNARRIKQGNVVLADAGKNGVVEVLGGDGNNYTVLNKSGEQINIPANEIGETHTVSWNDFKEYAKAPKDKVQEAFDNLQSGEKRIITDNFRNASDAVDKVMKESNLQFFDKEKIMNSSQEQQRQILDEIYKAENLNDDQKYDLANYIFRANAQKRMQDSFNTQVEDAAEKGVDAIKKNINPDMGGVVRAKVAGNDRIITRGKIVLNEDGTVNREQSDPQIYYKDENGKTQIAPIDHVEETEFIPQSDALNQAVDMKTKPLIMQQANDENPYVGQQYDLNLDGRKIGVKVNSLNEDGTYNIQYTDEKGNVLNENTISEDELKQIPELSKSKENGSPDGEESNQMKGNTTGNPDGQDKNADNSENQKKIPSIDEITSRAPKQKNGKVDYNALMEQAPDDYAALLENRTGKDDAKKELVGISNNLQNRIDAENKKLAKETDLNKREDIKDDVDALTEQKRKIDEVVKNRYEQEEVSAESIAKKIADGNKDWTPEELQFQQNNPQEVEKAVRDIQQKQENKQATKNVTKIHLNEQQTSDLVSRMEEKAEDAPVLELTPENWENEFGDDGIVKTPIGEVKMGDNQYRKIIQNRRQKEFGMIKPTLTNPDVIIEVPSESKAGTPTERPSSYLFVKTFNQGGKSVKFFTSVTVSKEGLEVIVSNHIESLPRMRGFLRNGNLLYRRPDMVPGAETSNPVSTGQTTEVDNNVGTSSPDKGTSNSSNLQASNKKNTPDAVAKKKQSAKTEKPKSELQKFIDNTTPSNLYEAALLHLMSRGGSFSRKDYFHDTGYGNNDLGRLKFKLTNDGTPFDAFEQDYYSKYRPEAFERGFDSNTDEIVQAINDYKAAKGSGYELMKKFAGNNDPYSKYTDEELAEMDANYKEQERLEEQAINEEEQQYNEIKQKIIEEDFVSLKRDAEELGIPKSEFDNTHTFSDIIDLIERYKDEIQRRGIKGNSGQDEISESERNSPEPTKGTTEEGNRSGENRGIESQDTDSKSNGLRVPQRETGRKRTGGETREQELTPLQQKYVDEQTAAYDKKIELTKKELDSAVSKRNEEINKLNQANSLFREETEERNLFGDEGMTDVSKDNAKRIHEKYQSAVDKAKDEYSRLLKERPASVERFTQEAQSQKEIEEKPEKTVQEQLDDVGGDILSHARNVAKNAEVKAEEGKVDTQPTEGQKEAGNYRKGHVNIQGFDVSIEQPKGSTRSGRDENGNEWSQKMNNTYGYIRGTKGTDGDHIDVFLGDNPSSDKVFVVDQINPNTRTFDEHKVMMGFNSLEEARKAYLSNYEDGWKGLGNITETNIDDFRKWAEMDGRRIKPFGEYKANIPERPTYNGGDVLDYAKQVNDWNEKYGKDDSGRNNDLEEVNTRFNEELDALTSENASSKVLKLGNPSDILLSAGIEDKPLKLYGNKLISKSKKHGFDISDLKDLPKAAANPIAIFKGNTPNSYAILTEINIKGDNVLATLNVGKGEDIDFNIITSTYGKSNEGIVGWINKGKLLYSNKEKTLDYLRIPAPIAGAQNNPRLNSEKNLDYLGTPAPIAGALNNQELESATKIVEDFENPKLPGEKLQESSVNHIDNASENIVSEPAIDIQRSWSHDSDVKSNMPEGEGLPQQPEGEITYAERVLSEQKGITFIGESLTGKTKIESSQDIAFLFKNLESAASENAFSVLHKEDGTYSVLYLSTGTSHNVLVDVKQIAAAIKETGATAVTLVHNHPSGSLTVSPEDYKIHESMRVALNTIVNPSIIINLDSGKYVEFDLSHTDEIAKTKQKGDFKEAKVYQFDRLKLYRNYPDRLKMSTPEDVASFLSYHKRGTTDKIQLLVLDNQNKINRYALLEPDLSGRDLLNRIVEETGKHGDGVALVSNGVIGSDAINYLQRNLNKTGIRLVDALTVKQDDGIISNYISAASEGLLGEKNAQYNQVGESKAEVPKINPKESILDYADRVFEWYEKQREAREKGAGSGVNAPEEYKNTRLPDVDVNESRSKDTNISDNKNANSENDARFQVIENKGASELYKNKENFPERKEGEDFLDYLSRIAKWGEEQREIYTKNQEQPSNTDHRNSNNLVGISHDWLNDMASRIGLPPIESGHYYNLKEQIERGRRLLVAGADPKQIENDFYDKNILDGNGISVMRAHLENLYNKINSIKDINSIAYKDTFDDIAHYVNVIGNMSGKTGANLGLFRGARDTDTDSFLYNTLALKRKTGKPITEEQRKKIENLTNENEHLKQQISENTQLLTEAQDKEHSENIKPERNNVPSQKKDIVVQGKILADRIRKAKIHRPDSFMVATPPSLAWDGAVEIVAKSVETGARLADAIQQGIGYIRNTDWYKNLSDERKDRAEEDFVNWNNEQSGLTSLQSRFADKFDNKFTREEAKAIWNYMKQNYLNNGTPYVDAVDYVANDLGLTIKQVSHAIITPKNKPLADAVWKANRDLRRNRNATQRWIDEQAKSKAYRNFKKVVDIPKEAAVFGHGGIFVGTHAMTVLFDLPRSKYAVKAFFDAYKFAYGNTADYEMMMRDLQNSPNYVKAQRAGLQNDPNARGSDSEIASNWFKKWSTAGERGFNAIKVLRQNLFDSHYEQLSAAERDDPEALKSIAQLVNNATGATNMNMPGWVQDVTFAGGMEASRWERVVKNPVKALSIFAKWKNASTGEKVFARIWAKRAGIITGTYLSALAINNALNYYFANGDDKHKINFFNPLKGDWMQFKIGNVNLNPTSGMVSTLRFAIGLTNIAFANKGSIENDYHANNRLEAAEQKAFQYAEGKLSPFYSTVLENAVHHDYNGNTLPWYDDKPLHSYNHKLSYTEYLLSKSPLPIAEASQVYNEAIRSQGATDEAVNAWWKAIEQGAISGTTGARLYSNDKQSGEKYNSLVDYFKKGTDDKYSEINNRASTVVSKADDYKKDVKSGKMSKEERDQKLQDLNYKKYRQIDRDVKKIKRLEKRLPETKGEKKENIENSIIELKQKVIETGGEGE